MKKLLGTCLLFLLSLSFALPFNVDAYVSVRGHYRKNGTYVAPYVRSNPNGLKYDNYSYTPSQGLYNASYGTKGTTWDTPTYITDPSYYTGKNIYDSNQASYGSPVASYNTYSLPSKTSSQYNSTYFKSTMTIPYVVKNWVDNNPNVPCGNSTFLIASDILTCNDYRTNKDTYNWVATNFKETENYSMYLNKIYSCPDK